MRRPTGHLALLALTAVAAAAAAGPAPAREHGCAAVTPSTRPAGQLVTVAAPTARSTTAAVRLWRRAGSCWLPAGGPWPARVGRNGISDAHREGDGTTPAGAYRLGPVVYGTAAPDPGVRYAYHRLRCGDWWDEDPASPGYNSFRHVPCGARPPFGGGSEALWLQTRAYARFAVVEYNASPAVPGRGSAIFLHVDTGRATNGCVSLPATGLDALLRSLQPARSPLILIGTRRRLGGLG